MRRRRRRSGGRRRRIGARENKRRGGESEPVTKTEAICLVSPNLCGGIPSLLSYSVGHMDQSEHSVGGAREMGVVIGVCCTN